MVTSCHHSSNVGEGVFADIRTQRVLEGLVFVLRQPFFDREYNDFRQHELRRGRCQPRNKFCNALGGEHSISGSSPTVAEKQTVSPL